MNLQQIGQQLRGLKDKSWGLVAEAFTNIQVALTNAYEDMGYFEITPTTSGLRKDRLDTNEMRLPQERNRYVICRVARGGILFTLSAEQMRSASELDVYTRAEVRALAGVLVEYTLTANLVLDTQTDFVENGRLTIYVFADATTFYTVSFDPAYFADSSSAASPDVGKATVYEFIGRSDGRWWPTSIPRTNIDPA